jgi:hypothetical protein
VLIADATAADAESVVGDECHIVSPQGRGPRHDPEFPVDRLDAPENLILLCRVHHKNIDDQVNSYTVEQLATLKAKHEKWVEMTLTEMNPVPPVKVRPIKGNTPTHLIRVTSARDAMAVFTHACASTFEHDEPKSEAEVELLARFLQGMQDWGDLSSDLDAADRVRVAYDVSALLKELDDSGFWVFAGRENQQIEGGLGPPSAFPIAHLSVLQSTNQRIIRVNVGVPMDIGQVP